MSCIAQLRHRSAAIHQDSAPHTYPCTATAVKAQPSRLCPTQTPAPALHPALQVSIHFNAYPCKPENPSAEDNNAQKRLYEETERLLEERASKDVPRPII